MVHHRSSRFEVHQSAAVTELCRRVSAAGFRPGYGFVAIFYNGLLLALRRLHDATVLFALGAGAPFFRAVHRAFIAAPLLL